MAEGTTEDGTPIDIVADANQVSEAKYSVRSISVVRQNKPLCRKKRNTCYFPFQVDSFPFQVNR
jgi:hypothetical protein